MQVPKLWQKTTTPTDKELSLGLSPAFKTEDSPEIVYGKLTRAALDDASQMVLVHLAMTLQNTIIRKICREYDLVPKTKQLPAVVDK